MIAKCMQKQDGGSVKAASRLVFKAVQILQGAPGHSTPHAENFPAKSWLLPIVYTPGALREQAQNQSLNESMERKREEESRDSPPHEDHKNCPAVSRWPPAHTLWGSSGKAADTWALAGQQAERAGQRAAAEEDGVPGGACQPLRRVPVLRSPHSSVACSGICHDSPRDAFGGVTGKPHLGAFACCPLCLPVTNRLVCSGLRALGILDFKAGNRGQIGHRPRSPILIRVWVH
ncbi:unnamed protein product [Rangifer tarandus platyrhynchus]|uniref:Uncharacterized protein n=1 Tax=Rangifer tarandus platyrhynchus TaxID=3082113 RepID=A0ABN9A1C7_RANTA|nr:unnamed protein product [Rangifer tarandus platyrhynchus]